MVQVDQEHISELNYNKLGTDFKVEAVAANLLKYYQSTKSIFVKRVGINDRPYLKDIKNIYATYYGLDEETVIIETYRESLYDYLPEGLFHPPSLGVDNRNVESVVKEIRRQKEVEQNARNFFQPFELEFFYAEVSALLKETEFNIFDASNSLVQTMKELWPLLQEVDTETARTFFYLLPFLHEVRGNARWIERFLSAFLNLKVAVDFVPNAVDSRDDGAGVTRLGKATLGITLIPNGRHLDGERNWRLNIGPIPYSDLQKYIPGHPFRQLLQSIYDYLLPVSVKIEENFVTEKNNESFILTESLLTDRLGFSTFL